MQNEIQKTKETILEVLNECDGLSPFDIGGFTKTDRLAFIELVAEGAVELWEDDGLLIVCWVGY